MYEKWDWWDEQEKVIDCLKETDVQKTMTFEEREKIWVQGKEYETIKNIKHPLILVKPLDPPLDPSQAGWVSYNFKYSVSPSGNLKFKKITSEAYGTEGKV